MDNNAGLSIADLIDNAIKESRESEFDREELDRQLATQIKASQLAEGV